MDYIALSSDRAALAAIARALKDLQYGSLEIVVHDGRIVQLERREKVRVAAEVRTTER